MTVRVWVDADSCPKAVREIVARAAHRRGVPATFVANRRIQVPPSELVSSVEVSDEEGSADDYIAEQAGVGDVAVTRDIPLAARLVEQGLVVLNDRGNVYTSENVRERRSVRDFMQELRADGLYETRTRSFSQKEVKAFADAFDRELTRQLRVRDSLA